MLNHVNASDPAKRRAKTGTCPFCQSPVIAVIRPEEGEPDEAFCSGCGRSESEMVHDITKEYDDALERLPEEEEIYHEQ